tara:strand:+ start:1566 stop:3350 length:1785 start_codon:yes stop_codon:yes gene_type:complete
MRLSNSDYWDLFICNDCRCSLDQPAILSGACLIIDVDVNNPYSLTGDSLCSLVGWSGDTCFESLSLPKSALTINDIGLTGIDNGFVLYDCTASTSSSTFIDVFTGTSLTFSSADTKFCFTEVTGCTYDYPVTILDSGSTIGKYAQLCGGFYQGFFKLSDRTFFEDISNNMFTWPISWFVCPPDCGTAHTATTCCISQYSMGPTTCCPDPHQAYRCYEEKKPIPYDYQILPTRYDCGWTAEFWIRRNAESCTGNTGNTLNALYPDNEGFFYYMGTRAENKFWDLFSGETGYTTSSGYPLPPPKISKQVLLNNPFLVYQPGGCCCFTGITTETTQQRDRNADIVNNALGFRIRNDGSIGYRSIGMSGVCSAVTATTVVDCATQCSPCTCGGGFGYTCCPTGSTTAITVTEKWVTGTTVNESYSASGMVKDNEWTMVAVRFTAYEVYELIEISNVPRRKGRLDFIIDGYLKYSIDDFDEFLFKDLYEYREKQEGVPFNYSLGGGTQGLLETNTVNGPDPRDENLVIQENFAGTFFGDLSKFRLYDCCLDITTIRYRFNQLCNDFGICPFDIDCYLQTNNNSDILSEDGNDLLTWCDE